MLEGGLLLIKKKKLSYHFRVRRGTFGKVKKGRLWERGQWSELGDSSEGRRGPWSWHSPPALRSLWAQWAPGTHMGPMGQRDGEGAMHPPPDSRACLPSPPVKGSLAPQLCRPWQLSILCLGQLPFLAPHASSSSLPDSKFLEGRDHV